MALLIPTNKELYDLAVANLESELGIPIPRFGKNYLRAQAAVLGAVLWLLYKTLSKVQQNIFVDTADPESSGGTLERFGRVKLGRDPFPATNSFYTLEVTGSIGAVIAAGTTFKSDDTSKNPGKLYSLDTEKTLVAETDTILVRSLETGLETRQDVGNTMTITAPVANVDRSTVITVEDVIPLAAEDIEVYRQRAIEAYQLEAQGGAATDYRLWSADAQGVLRVYPVAKSGAPWEIDVFVEATIADSTDGKGTPTPAILTDVEEVIEFDPDDTKELNERGRRPLNVIVNVLPVTPLSVDVEFINFTNLTPELEVVIQNALFDYLQTVRPFIAGADVLTNKNDVLTASKLIFAVQAAIPDSAFFENLLLTVDGNPIATSFTFLNGDIPFLNNITYS